MPGVFLLNYVCSRRGGSTWEGGGELYTSTRDDQSTEDRRVMETVIER